MDYLRQQIEAIDKKIEETKKLLTDPALSTLASKELADLEKKKGELSVALEGRSSKEAEELKAAIIEIRAAAGGDEAGLFASDLYRMYTRFAESKSWKTEQISVNEGGLGNIKEVIFRVVSNVAFDQLKFESGVHRVQRVPVTESSGRIHTSTATVAVLAEISDKEFHIDPKELKVETYRASGHGGQNVQKVESAVRITHTPTGIVATCQTERSQFQNKEKALTVLRSRLYETEQKAKRSKVDTERKLQVGTGERSEKIRTYNFPQDRITDHRINKSWHNIEEIMDGHLDPIISTFKEA